ncbi:unnamed protein product [Linum trigynum]|uniref:TF-B3 domain-containing protein n=1 Tax=Linum trigynum TaxID=586398 RepID=A0AAV2FST3_9ROSI
MAEGAHRRTPMAKKPRFSTLILPGMVRDWRLAVPKLFAEEYGDRLSNRAVFKLPDGAEWPIRLSGSGDKIWFSEGWRQFADFYSVKSMGYFLVFEYIGNSRFLVAVFHPSASEISYPPSHVANSNRADDGGERGDEEDGESVEISCSSPSSPETRQVSPVNNCSRPPKLQKGLARGSGSETTPDDELSSDSSQEVEGCPVNRMFGRPEPLSAAKKASALTRARAASDKPFFMLAMQPSSVYAPMCCNLPLPVYFSERYLNDNFRETVLQLPGGRRAWIVESSVTSNAGKKRVFFHHQSWLAFAKDTNLKVGDVCAFELMDGGAKPTFEVTIFRAAQGSGSSPGGNGGVCRRTLSAALPGRGVLKRNMQSSKGEENCYRQSTVFGSSSKSCNSL